MGFGSKLLTNNTSLYSRGMSMRLREIILQNFRSYKDETRINVGDLTALIGRGDTGKSSILEALEIFFNNSLIKMDPSDISVFGDGKEVLIGCVFDTLPEEVILDQTAQTTLSDEHLLNEEGFLEPQDVQLCTQDA